MKSMMKFAVIIFLLTAFSMASCENGAPGNNEPGGIDNDFVPVTGITGVKNPVPVGTVSLGGKVVPSGATYKTIRWTVISGGDIVGVISGNNLTTTEEGSVKVRAIVENGKAAGVNFTKDFVISVEPFVAVTDITDVPTEDEVGEIFLDATVHPDDASYTDIEWSVKNSGKTKATIKGDVLTAKAGGTVIVTATIVNGLGEGKDYTKHFSINVIDDDDDEYDDDDDNDINDDDTGDDDIDEEL